MAECVGVHRVIFGEPQKQLGLLRRLLQHERHDSAGGYKSVIERSRPPRALVDRQSGALHDVASWFLSLLQVRLIAKRSTSFCSLTGKGARFGCARAIPLLSFARGHGSGLRIGEGG